MEKLCRNFGEMKKKSRKFYTNILKPPKFQEKKNSIWGCYSLEIISWTIEWIMAMMNMFCFDHLIRALSLGETGGQCQREDLKLPPGIFTS